MDVNFRFIGKMCNVTFCIEVRYDKIFAGSKWGCQIAKLVSGEVASITRFQYKVEVINMVILWD